MAVRKRFCAGAKCPACQAQDSLAMWRENNVDVVECVKCGHQMREADKEAREACTQRGQVIGIFIPTSVIRRLF
ncbi:YheV family putative metal-binding protein [Klebsiella pneumoniae]|nr:YheV family putative metal-binding protein [Klebsiella pneumoniae]